jgi:hypothetical protein
MNNGIPFFKKIDEFIFAQIDNLKASSAYQQLIDQASELDDESQKKINYGLSVLIVLLPIMVIFFLVWKNIDVNNSLKLKRSIQLSTSEISSKIRRLKNVEMNVIGPNIIASEGELQNSLKNILKSQNIGADKFNISEFDISESITNLKRVSAVLGFRDLSINQLTNVLRELISTEKMIVPDLVIKKDPATELLTGSIKIYHHFRNE